MFEIGAAIIAGIVATVVMTAVMYLGRAMLPQQMPMNILHMLGTMMTRSTGPAYMIGGMMHFMNGILFAIVHAAIYAVLGLTSGLLLWGLLFGAFHWLITGVGMGMMPMMHPVIKAGDMDAPGAFAKNLPMLNIMGFLMAHLIFGLVVGVVYEALAG